MYFFKIRNSFFKSLEKIFLFCSYSKDPEKIIYFVLILTFFKNFLLIRIPFGKTLVLTLKY